MAPVYVWRLPYKVLICMQSRCPVSPLFLHQIDEAACGAAEIAAFFVAGRKLPCGAGGKMETTEVLIHVLHIVVGQDSAAHVGPYHGDNGMVIACLKEDLGCKACLRENTVQHGVHGGMAVHEHKGLVLLSLIHI